MCVGIPGKILKIKGKKAKIAQANHYHWVDLGVLFQKVKVGDYLIIYQNVAINKISKREAKEIISLMDSTSNTRVKSSN